jgi:hypothetical protein
MLVKSATSRAASTIIARFLSSSSSDDPWVQQEEEPPPFTCTRVGDTDMYCTTVVKRDGRAWPFFLATSTYEKLVDFVQEIPGPDPRVMILTGPVKSGKTDVLHLVLPSIIARERGVKKRRPFVVRFTCDLRQGPEHAARALLEEAKRASAPMGISVQLEYAPGWALRNIDAILGSIADQLVERNAEMWLLMDECQVRGAAVSWLLLGYSLMAGPKRASWCQLLCLVLPQAPLLASKTIEEGWLWMSALKRMVAIISPVGHVVWTGSAVVTFLNQIRMIPVNGFMLMSHVHFVRLGGTPSISAATAMALALGQAYAAAKAWPEPVQRLVDSGAIVQKLDSTVSRGFLSARPALVSHVFGQMGAARITAASADKVVDAAIAEVRAKLVVESRSDFTAALRHLELSPEIKQGLYELGHGNRQTLDDLQLGHTATKMLLLLCEEPAVGGKGQPALLPPYSSFIKECLNKDGDVIVRWSGNKDELGEKLRGILNFHSETYAHQDFNNVHLARISAAVVESLLANGIGVKGSSTGRLRSVGCAGDIAEVPVLLALLQDSANSMLALEHVRKLDDAQRLPSYNAAVGFHVLRWARNVASHHQWAASVLATQGLSVPVLDAAARAGASAVCGVREYAGFAFRLDERGIPARVRVGRGLY